MSVPMEREDRIAALAAELGRLGRRLDDMGTELISLSTGGATSEGTAPPVQQPAPAPPEPGRPAYPNAAHPGPAGPDAEADAGHPGAAYPGAGYPGAGYPDARYSGAAYPGAGYPGIAYAGAAYAGAGHLREAHPDAAYPGPARPDPADAGAGRPGATYPSIAHPGQWPPGYAQPGRPAPSTYPSYPGRYPVAHPGPARGPGPLRTWLSSLSGARLLAWTGAGVTLLGVVLLLALAASRGWFSPAGRVIAGAVLGVALVGVAVRLHRRESARTGALALAGTGIATLYLVVAASTALYGFLPAVAGLLLALLVAGGGLALADRWGSQLLAGGAVGGAAVLAPVVTGGFVPLLVGLVLALQVAALPVVLRRQWPWLAAVAAAGPVLFGSLTALVSSSGADRPWTVAAVAAVLVVGLVGAVVAARVVPVGRAAGLLVAAPVPALVASGAIGGWSGAAPAAGAALLLLLLAAWTRLDRVLRIAALAAGSVALFHATAVALDGAAETAVLLGQALVLVVVAAALRSRVPLVIGGAYGVVGVLAALATQVPPVALATFPAAPFLVGGRPQTSALVAGIGVSALVLAFAVAVMVSAARVGVLTADRRTAQLWVPAGLVALYGAAGLVLTVALLVSPDRTGFVAGHAVVSVSWTIVALVLLARGISRPALRVSGLVLVAAAVAKLILFDLVALDGIARVAAFLGAGLVLLAAGTRYARLVAEAETEDGGGPAAGPAGARGPVQGPPPPGPGR
ncbi:DUF2339 domain-containing protein [Pseudonocardia bannensis]|uniref:DUF2339 domain-containing protein n=1 Tax=Pseudonocardia bannensis TaxID=630973 RepID=A0A848DFJ8_9PSEU|nr:DUF2339 domain-containing protein [Pseudonocardia bannensis]NMH91339.1 DUF2339 domain-containing protein [Pseudonocardia bannensis]